MSMQPALKLTTALFAATAWAIATVPDPAAAQVQVKSTWEQIMSAKKLRSGVLDGPPYFWRDTTTGSVQGWRGAMVSMSEDIAKQLGVELELVEVGGWGQVVLQLQTNKIDMHFSLQATPVRAKAIDFAGPAYWISFVMVNSEKFKGKAKTWDDYNKPSVKVAVELGSANETILRKMAPKATVEGLTQLPEAILSVTSGRADAFVTTTMTALISKNRNPQLGEFVVPTPIVALPGYIGVRMEDDARFQKFLQRWSEWNLLLGINEKLLKENLNVMGIKDIPETVHF